MGFIKNIIVDSREIIVTYVFSYILILGACLLYSLFGFQSLDFFITHGCNYILLVYYVIVIIYICRKNKKKLQEEVFLPIKGWYPLVMLGISLAIVMNMIIFFFVPPQGTVTNSFVFAIISSGIIGPIYEELLFRFLLYNRLKEKYHLKSSMIIATILFALIHMTPIKIIYAFILGLVLTILYERQTNILVPIIVHMVANGIVLLLNSYNSYVLILSIFCLILGIKIYSQKIKL